MTTQDKPPGATVAVTRAQFVLGVGIAIAIAVAGLPWSKWVPYATRLVEISGSGTYHERESSPWAACNLATH
jgi:hypothetical protein